MTMGNREFRQMLTAVRRLGGHSGIAPKGVRDQLKVRTASAISPLPTMGLAESVSDCWRPAPRMSIIHFILKRGVRGACPARMLVVCDVRTGDGQRFRIPVIRLRGGSLQQALTAGAASKLA